MKRDPARAPERSPETPQRPELPDAGYGEILADIKRRIDSARTRALRAANSELMRDFARTWTEEEILQRGVATLPWATSSS